MRLSCRVKRFLQWFTCFADFREAEHWACCDQCTKTQGARHGE